MSAVIETPATGTEEIVAARIQARSPRRRRTPDPRTVVTTVALLVVTIWTILFGIGIVLR
jgi:hypothetical protein